jgi:hypothetical protein
MVELHVDDIPDNKLLTIINNEYPMGGNLSIRKSPDEKPLIAFGHDECIFRQLVFTGSAWQGTKGEQAIIPKDEGNGIMVSALQSREFVFGLPLTINQLQSINDFRKSRRPNYTEADSTIKINGTTEKKDLSESPFIKYFEYGYGAGKEGYWTYDHMALQFEDCVDCIQALFPHYDSMWMFDHSCGHDRGREDGLLVGNMQTL